MQSKSISITGHYIRSPCRSCDSNPGPSTRAFRSVLKFDIPPHGAFYKVEVIEREFLHA